MFGMKRREFITVLSGAVAAPMINAIQHVGRTIADFIFGTDKGFVTHRRHQCWISTIEIAGT